MKQPHVRRAVLLHDNLKAEVVEGDMLQLIKRCPEHIAIEVDITINTASTMPNFTADNALLTVANFIVNWQYSCKKLYKI